MNLREAAQQALEALELGCTDHEGNEVDLVWPAITALRAALAEDVPETNFGNMAKVVDFYGDGNVYRGQRSRDSQTPTLTINGMPAVEGPLSKAQPTSQESRQVEPVAYVTGFSKGYAVVQPVDRSLLMPVGMALYRSRTTINEMETVEPVAWLIEAYDIYEKCALQRLVFDKPKNMQGVKITAYYIAPPKREPLTEAELEPIRRRMMMEAYNAADDGDSERYNALKVMANDVLDMLLGGEK